MTKNLQDSMIESELIEPEPLSPVARQAIATLRTLIPKRRVSFLEAMHIAERQATALRALLNVTGPGFPVERIVELPKVTVMFDRGIPISGASFWDGGQWVIDINADEPPARQRFTLLHELKHIIDHPHQDVLFSPARTTGTSQRELAADYFAACVLMPARQFRAAYRKQPDHGALAELFGVHPGGIDMRLSELGMADGIPSPQMPPQTSRAPSKQQEEHR